VPEQHWEEIKGEKEREQKRYNKQGRLVTYKQRWTETKTENRMREKTDRNREIERLGDGKMDKHIHEMTEAQVNKYTQTDKQTDRKRYRYKTKRIRVLIVRVNKI
jgi:hypothetical protein